MEKKNFLKSLIFFFSLGFLFLIPSVIFAADLGFSPTSTLRTVGSTFSTSVYVSSPSQTINAASGVVSFPADKLEVVSITKAGSVMTLWVQEPTFSNITGTAQFEGIVLNPGFIGNNGTIITITFRTKAAGQANIKFSSGSILANDGVGTNILNGLGTATVSIQAISPSTDTVKDKPKTEVKTVKTEEVEIIDEKVSIEIPIITYYKETIEADEVITIHGIANPGVDVMIRLFKEGGLMQEKVVRSTGSGNFVAGLETVSQFGVYTFTAQAIDEAGNMSQESSPFTIIINQKWLSKLIETILGYLSLVVILGLVLAGVVVLGTFIWYKMFSLIRRMNKENKEAEKSLEKSFNILHNNINEHITRLKKINTSKKLVSDEITFLEEFDEELTDAKKVIAKEIQDVCR